MKNIFRRLKDSITQMNKSRPLLSPEDLAEMKKNSAYLRASTAYEDFERFAFRLAAPWFNEAAARNPEKALELRRMAELAAKIDPGKKRGMIEAYGPGEEEQKEWHLCYDEYRDGIMRRAAEKLDFFRATHPGAWEAMEKNAPDLARRILKYKKPS